LKSNISSVLQIIKNDVPQKNHFFNNLHILSKPEDYIQPLINEGFFNPKNNPEPIRREDRYDIPFWYPLNFLQLIADRNFLNPKPHVTKKILEIINPIIDFRDTNGNIIENDKTDRIVIETIFKLPKTKITQNYIDYFEKCLKSRWGNDRFLYSLDDLIIPILIKTKNKQVLLKVIRLILDYDFITEYYGRKIKSIVNERLLEHVFQHHLLDIYHICKNKLTNVFITQIDKIVKIEKNQFNIAQVKLIEDDLYASSDNYQFLIVRCLRDLLIQENGLTIKNYVKKLLQRKHEIYKRITIYIISKRYEVLRDLFWNLDYNPLNDFKLKPELHFLFRENSMLFSHFELEKAIEWIETNNYFIPKEYKGDSKTTESIIFSNKKGWYYSLLNSENSKIKKLYNKYNEMDDTPLDHHDKNNVIGQAMLIKPKEDPDLNNHFQNSIKQGIKYLEKNITKNGNYFDNSILESFGKLCINTPDLFINNIDSFIDTSYWIKYRLINSLWELQCKNIHIQWEKLLPFINEIASDDELWLQYKIENDSAESWLINQIADLIRDGFDERYQEIPKEQYMQVECILENLETNTKPNLVLWNDDIVTSVLNSVKGKIYATYVRYSNFYSKENFNKEDEKKWNSSVKTIFTTILNDDSKQCIEFYNIVGKFLINLYIMDKQWVIDNINKIFNQTNDLYFESVISGYLFFTNRIYNEVFQLLDKNNHFERALELEFKDDRITKRLIQQICVAYINDFEGNDKLLEKVFNDKKKNQIEEIVHYFWMLREQKIPSLTFEKFKTIWKRLYYIFKEKVADKDYRKIIIDLSHWLSLVDKIDDDILVWLKFSASNFNFTYESSIFIEYLNDHVKQYPKEVGEIFVTFVENDFYPDYQKEHIVNIIETQYLTNNIENADIICNRYMQKGLMWVREHYEKYHKTK